MSGSDLEAALANIRGAGRDYFINEVRNDIADATRCAQNAGLNFDNPLTAVIHYRKYGAEFPQVMRKFGDGISVRLGPIEDEIFKESNQKKTYYLPVGSTFFTIRLRLTDN